LRRGRSTATDAKSGYRSSFSCDESCEALKTTLIGPDDGLAVISAALDARTRPFCQG